MRGGGGHAGQRGATGWRARGGRRISAGQQAEAKDDDGKDGGKQALHRRQRYGMKKWAAYLPPLMLKNKKRNA